MTLIVAVMSSETIWLMADRRLSSRGQPLRDDACKVMTLETVDGVAILGYAGLGATAQGTEPSDWMSNVLRGRNMPLEASLGVLANAAKAQLPRHLKQLGHTIIVPAFVGDSPRVYAIEWTPQQKSFRYTRVRSSADRVRPCELAIGGSGVLPLVRDKRWMRAVLRLVKAHERNVLSAHSVADHLARLNFDVYRAMVDQTVGPRCIVVWRHRKGGKRGGGGAHGCYTGTSRDNASTSLPTIANGLDVRAIVSLLLPSTMSMMDAMQQDEPFQRPDETALNAELRKLPHGPDERLK